MNNNERDLIIPAINLDNSTCAVLAADIERLQLCPNLLYNCKPVATKSGRFQKDYFIFIEQQIQEWLMEGVIRPKPVFMEGTGSHC